VDIRSEYMPYVVTDGEPYLQIRYKGGFFGIIVPHLGLASIAALIAPVSYVPWRFSLRTLLIATTLIAVGLGLIVWLR
jgi:hypothetical protein